MHLKISNDGTHSQCYGTHTDHGLWVAGTHKEVNNSESLSVLYQLKHGELLFSDNDYMFTCKEADNINGLAQDSSNSSALAVELL